MVVIDTKHALTENELSILKSLIGKVMMAIQSQGVEMWTSVKGYHFNDTIDLKMAKGEGFVSITADFDETRFGEDLHNVTIQKSAIPKGVKTDNGIYREPYAHLGILPEFTIAGIDIYGYSFQAESENINPNPFWSVEKDNPGQPIQENVETENIILFHSTDGRKLLIEPIGAVPWMLVTIDDQPIPPPQKSLDGKPEIKLKRTIR